MEIKITKNPNPAAKPEASALGFGKYFTDHMFLMDYSPEKGWHDARIVPFGCLPLHPAATVLHYGAEVFEGMKAYRNPQGEVQLFRPRENARRINSSAERIRIPQLPEDHFLEAVNALVAVDQDWVPSAPGASLYIRPFLFGNDETLGVHTIHNGVFCIILSPVGSYYKGGLSPVKITIETQDVRAVRGGTGYTKCGGNYAASMRAGEEAEKKGFTQVLWLDGVEQKYVEEVGSMNIMFKIAGKLITPALLGSILPGITRDSILQLARDWGVPVEERRISIDEVVEAAENGTLEEVWGTGTAAVVSPVGELYLGDKCYTVNDGKIGALTQRFYDTLTGIQWGRLPDPHGWIWPVK